MIDYILSPLAVRDRAHQMFRWAMEGNTHFKLNLEKLDQVSDYVLEVIHENYPTLEIPFHSRKNHINAGGVSRTDWLDKKLIEIDPNMSRMERAKVQFELVVVSVLLDAGAGNSWKYHENSTQKEFSRSEGLAVASFDMFCKGVFAKESGKNSLEISKKTNEENESLNQQNNIYKATGFGLASCQVKDLEESFQVNSSNPLQGVLGRVHLLNSLGKIIQTQTKTYPHGRLGDAMDFIIRGRKSIQAEEVLQFVLKNWGEIWPARLKWQNQPLGDVWTYTPFADEEKVGADLVPFHKLSQWLTYSLLVPIMEAGIEVKGVEKMTGLPEYRNGGLFLDFNVLELKDPEQLKKTHKADDPLIIEWRALTVALLDKVGQKIQEKLNMSPAELPLAKVLEGGTWAAGRKIAKSLRPGGVPPLNIESDGTVF